VLRRVRHVLGGVNLHPVHEEDPLAEAVMAPGIRLIAVEAKALAASFRHLLPGEATEVALAATRLIGR
jgi:hypothetical protein